MSNGAQGRAGRTVRAATSVILVLLTLVAVLVLLLGVFARPGRDGISRLAGHPILSVLSGSMVPVFRPGDLVLEDHVSAAQAARLAPGDIVTFHVAGSTTELITHKIVAIRPQGSSTPHGVADSSSIRYQTKGVANNAPDATLVAPNQVVGVYHFNIPFGGYFLQAIQHKVVFFFVMFVPLLFLISSEIAKRWHEPEPVRSRELPKGRSHRKPRQPSGQPAVSVEATLTSASDADVDTRGGGSELSRR